ncbi:hypothetical protein OTU49_000054 [Cherax quadricarinatus]|uniref:GAR domain-containing protein n=1 Tax=Cherax quadricarinatus TaxID=27406 RepID=A0AAW0Y2J4_CHEQU
MQKRRIPVTTTAMVSTSIDPYLLKGKHVMVRVGGGWDTLEHYLLRHDPKQVTVFNIKSTDPFLHIRAKYCSPTQSQASSTRGSPTHSRATPSRVTLSGDPSPRDSSSESTPPPPEEPQVPPSPPAVSSMHATESCVSITESSKTENRSFISTDECTVVDAEESLLKKEDSTEASFPPCSLNGTTEIESFELVQDDELIAATSSLQSQSSPRISTSSTPVSRPIVNSATFCIEDHKTDPVPTITHTSHSKSPSTSSASSSSSESTSSPESSSYSLKATPPPTPSTFSTPACATSAPLDLSLTTNDSNSTLGTPLPTDSTDHDFL